MLELLFDAVDEFVDLVGDLDVVVLLLVHELEDLAQEGYHVDFELDEKLEVADIAAGGKGFGAVAPVPLYLVYKLLLHHPHRPPLHRLQQVTLLNISPIIDPCLCLPLIVQGKVLICQ